MPLEPSEVQAIAWPLIAVGAILLVIGLLVLAGPYLASAIRGLGIPEPLKPLLLVGWRVGGVEVYTSPILILALAALYIILFRR